MKSPDEIKKGFECFVNGKFPGRDYGDCPYLERPSEREWQCLCEQIGSDALTLIQQLEDHIRDLAKMIPKWISVKERLPEDGQRVVGIAENGMTGIMDYRDDGTPFAARIFGVYFSNITHWMPLPEPPKEDE